MKDVFHSNGFKILIITVFVLFGLMLTTAGSGGSFLTDAFGFLSTPMERVSTLVTNNAAATAQSATQSKEELEAENERLKQQVDELNRKLINYYTYQQENAQLRKFLELKNDNKDFKPVSAAVIARDPSSLFYQFTIDQGSLAGISVYDPVITESGVAGWISSVSANYSRVTTILSPDTKISAMDKVNRESGVVATDIKLADQGVVKLGYLSADTKAKAGDIVVTNGLGGIYPRDLVVGTVKSVKNDPYDVSLYAEVTPFVDVKTVRDVMVITSFQGQGQALDDDTKSSSPPSSSSSSQGGK
ncbi:rod shape-determining protein MreC [Caproiciproducens sp. NJN-50]|uniref:rod shape-determining protein MreC n=1 Tax=Acutalibacteraceae TaxID=3082771 RepID=UPI000FFE000A|nr:MULTISPECIES: rod shape-determining protein MreC [Acutalibacteraceae]QAT51029.1 rod shape-determining protein MreC [Caproiciproducens sp. NJN-50]